MSVVQSVMHAPERYEFTQVVRLLRHLSIKKDIKYRPDPMPEGDNSDVVAIENLSSQVKITLGLEALSGCRGIIPDYLYNELLRSLHQGESPLQAFLDVFNHRYYELAANAVTTRNVLLREEQESILGKMLVRVSQKTALAQLSALPNSFIHRSDASLLRFSVLMGLKARTLKGLNQLLSQYFQLAVESSVIANISYRMPSESLSYVGQYLGRNNRLGQGLLIGKKGNQAYQSLEILIKPKNKKEFLGLSTNAHFANTLRDLVATYLRELIEVKIYLFVKRAYIDEPIISANGLGVKLGEANCLSPNRKSDEYRKILLQPERLLCHT